MSKSINYYYDTLVEKNQLTIKDLERRIEMSEEAIIRFKIENDILMEEINFLDQRRKENE